MLAVWLEKTGFNTKLTEIESKIPYVSNLVKKTDFNTKVTEIEGKIPDVNNLVKNTDLDTRLKTIIDRVTKNKSKHLLVENELKKSKAFDTSYFLGKNYFEGIDGTQNSSAFQVGEKYFKNNSGSNSSKISIRKSKGLSNQSLILSGTVGTANDIKMSKPIRPAYVILNHKESFFEQKKNHKKRINSKCLYTITIIYYKFR